ncbi:MAG: hypothetical protein CME88_07300 [Hirschia sp.]|nr:hypothetical protein [Hirschia sp.]MBF18167.1 hypothetical protein [Hirschia sp.]|tara:strand:- start:83 stop:1081 length:999 start_codon:yes stop_codon:yes gene_type:complete
MNNHAASGESHAAIKIKLTIRLGQVIMKTSILGAAACLVAGTSFLTVPQAHAGLLDAGMDNLCVLDSSGKTSKGEGGFIGSRIDKLNIGGGRLGEWGGDAKDMLKSKAGGLFKTSVVCDAKSHDERWILTALLLDHAALSAAQGINSAQAALGEKQTMLNEAAQIERALEGLGTGGSNVTVVTIQSASAQAALLRSKVEAMKSDGALTDAAKQHLADAARALDEVDYYGGTALAGLKLLNDYFASSDVQNVEKVQTVIASVGMDKDAIKNLGKQLKSLGATMKGTVTLRQAIGKVSREASDGKKAEKNARKQSQKEAKKVRKELQGKDVSFI